MGPGWIPKGATRIVFLYFSQVEATETKVYYTVLSCSKTHQFV